MFRNYFKSILRGLAKNRTHAVLNITGLTAGLTCFAFIALWVMDELSYDKFNTNYDRIVRLTESAKTETGIVESATSSAPMAKALQNDFAEVEATVRMDLRGDIITHNGKQMPQDNILLTDPSFFDVFNYKLTRGNVATAISEPYTIILTESAAKKYFGNSDPMGQRLLINMNDSNGRGAHYTITGIMPDPPLNAHLTFTMIASFKTIEVANPDILTVDGWGDASYYTYLLLKKGVDQKAFSNKISQFYKKYVGDRYNVWKDIYNYKLQPLGDIHLHSNLRYEIQTTGSAMYVYIFGTIGIFILLLAGINYMNLATVHSVSRAKEVGIKKVVGAERRQLIVQYLLEAVLIAFIALVLALVLCAFFQPAFFQLTGKDLSPLQSTPLLLFLTAVTISLGLMSGSYPAFIISGFKPIAVLKGSFKSGSKGTLLRKSLVVSQFVVTMLLVTGIVVIYSQLSYVKHKDLGYNQESLLYLRVNGNSDVMNGYAAFRNEILSNPLIKGATISNTLLGSLPSGGAETVDGTGKPLQVNTARIQVGANYFAVHDIPLVAGRDFDTNSKDSIRQVIINETSVRNFGWKDAADAIGKPFKIGDQPGEVIGVVKDFHFSNLYHAIGSLAIYPSGASFSRITLKTDITQSAAVANWVQKTWTKHFPIALFDYTFSKSVQQYAAEERFASLFLYFAVLSVLIACLGLYGLIAYTTAQKTKELGIRKVLGASAQGLAIMLSKDFLKLVVLAFVIATPLAWYVMNLWLQDFAYRETMQWWMFAIAGGGVLLIALLTVSVKSVKAAVRNPVESLRTE